MRHRPLILSFRDAFVGIAHAIHTQRNARIQIAAAIAVICLAAALRVPGRDWAVLFLATAAVLAAEIGNTVVEVLVDAVCPGPSEVARMAKDGAAGAVLMLAMGAAAAGVCILGPPLWDLVW